MGSELEEKNMDDNSKLLIQKSDPLLFMRNASFTLSELKLMDAYMAKINSHDISTQEVKIPLKEYMQIMGLKDVRSRDLEKALIALRQKSVEVVLRTDNNYKFKTWKTINLFEECGIQQVSKSEYLILIKCTEAAKELFFNVNYFPYIKYTLSIVARLKSTYSYLLYMYFKKQEWVLQDEKQKVWTIDLETLRTVWLKNNEIVLYDDFRYFKNRIIEKAITEINDKTDLNVNYRCLKNGRTVTGLEFSLESKVASPEVSTTSLDDQQSTENGEVQKGGNQPNQYVEGKMIDKEVPDTNKRSRVNYSKDFEEFWSAYPRKQDKGMALEKYKACVNAGYKPEELLTAAKRYAEQCHRNHTEQKYIKMARTFLGPSHPFEEFLDVVLKEEPEKTPEELEQERQFEEQLKKSMGLDKLEEEFKSERSQ